MHILLYKRNHLVGCSGGAEKIMITYANEFSARGHKVTLATRDTRSGDLFFPLNEKVVFKHFQFSFNFMRRLVGKIFSFCGIIKYFPYFNRELIISEMLSEYCSEIKPDVIIVAGIQELIDFTAYGERNYPVIMMMHGRPDVYFTPKRKKHYCQYINNAAAIQVLMPSFTKFVPENYEGIITTIGNPVPSVVHSDKRKNVIIYLARFDKTQKRQHLLIEIFSQIATAYPDWQLHFYGAPTNSEYFQQCQNTVAQYGLEKQILFKGITDIPLSILQQAKICAFPAAYEGFSLALTEAMAAGLPAIGFDDAPSVNEMIQSGVNGFLVKDNDEFAVKLALLMNDEALRQKMSVKAQNIAKAYSMENIMKQWEILINQVIKRDKTNE